MVDGFGPIKEPSRRGAFPHEARLLVTIRSAIQDTDKSISTGEWHSTRPGSPKHGKGINRVVHDTDSHQNFLNHLAGIFFQKSVPGPRYPWQGHTHRQDHRNAHTWNGWSLSKHPCTFLCWQGPRPSRFIPHLEKYTKPPHLTSNQESSTTVRFPAKETRHPQEGKGRERDV
jgi:hypothetical protein